MKHFMNDSELNTLANKLLKEGCSEEDLLSFMTITTINAIDKWKGVCEIGYLTKMTGYGVVFGVALGAGWVTVKALSNRSKHNK